MRRHLRARLATAAALAAAFALPRAAAAQRQDQSDSAAYLALIRTPLAAVPQPLDVSITGVHPGGPSYRLSYGLMSFDTHEYTHNFDLGVDLPVGGATVGLSVGYHWPNCNGVCSSNVMASAGVSERLASVTLGSTSESATLNIGLRTAAGFGTLTDTTMFSGLMSVPLSITPQSMSVQLVPWIAPGIGVGLVRQSGSTDAGLQFVLGAGLGVLSHGFRAGLGVNRVFLKDGNWLVGLEMGFDSR